jgi:ABC-type transporter Mla MlaB component
MSASVCARIGQFCAIRNPLLEVPHEAHSRIREISRRGLRELRCGRFLTTWLEKCKRDSAVLRIDEREQTQGCPTLVLSGSLTRDYVVELKRICDHLLDGEHTVTLNLKDLRFADRDGLAFLLNAADASVRLANCPPYIRRWIVQERRWRRTNG